MKFEVKPIRTSDIKRPWVACAMLRALQRIRQKASAGEGGANIDEEDIAMIHCYQEYVKTCEGVQLPGVERLEKEALQWVEDKEIVKIHESALQLKLERMGGKKMPGMDSPDFQEIAARKKMNSPKGT